MTTRVASCRCGALTATCEGEPVRISVCHCHNCQRRSGSVFAAQARWPVNAVQTDGEALVWEHFSDDGNWARFHFCPTCGSTVWYQNEGMPDLIAVAIGAFAEDAFPQPHYSIFEGRKKKWVEIVGDGIEHFD